MLRESKGQLKCECDNDVATPSARGSSTPTLPRRPQCHARNRRRVMLSFCGSWPVAWSYYVEDTWTHLFLLEVVSVICVTSRRRSKPLKMRRYASRVLKHWLSLFWRYKYWYKLASPRDPLDIPSDLTANRISISEFLIMSGYTNSQTWEVSMLIY